MVRRAAELALAVGVGASLAHWWHTRAHKAGFIEHVLRLLCAYLKPEAQAAAPVVRLRGPDELEELFARAGVPLALAKGEAPLGDEALLSACKLVLEYSVRSRSPYFFNQLYGRAELASVAGDWIAAAINCNVHTYEVAPVMTLIEHHVLARIARAIGPSFEASHDGLMVPGGSIANLYAMHLARHRAAPGVQEEGASAAHNLVAFVSEDAHYSYLKSARLIGLGSKNLVSVKSNDCGGMDPQALAIAIDSACAAGRVPFFVGATAGTTVRGGFDPLKAIAVICRSERAAGPNEDNKADIRSNVTRTALWMHVDAAWGGGALFSPAHRVLLDGVDCADSFAWSAHKQLGAALQAAVFITRHKGALTSANAVNAAYLFQPDKLHANLDVGDKTIQCGRRADMLKLWLLFKQLGEDGCARIVDAAFSLAAHLVRRIEASDGAFVLAYPPSGCNVCFWYVPKAMRPLPPNTELNATHPVNHVAPKIKAALQRGGHAMIGFQAVGGLPNFFRWVFASPGASVTSAHVDEVLGRIAEIGEST